MDYKQIASYGRNGDTELMHVSKSEVATLKGLGALTTNPHTGLPEAFQLSDLMPVLGIGASFLLGPLAGAAVSGVGTALKTHSLGQGLMSGLASWGMGSLLSGAGATAGSAADTAGQAAGQTAGEAVPGASTAMANPGFSNFGSNAAGAGSNYGTNLAGSAAPNTAFDPGYSSMAASGQPAAGAPGWSMDQAQKNLGSSDWWATQKPAGYAAGIGAYGLSALQEQQKQADAANALNASNQAKLKQQHDQYLQAAGQAYNMNPYNYAYQPGSPLMAASGGLIGDSGLYGLHAHQPLIADKMHTTYAPHFADGGYTQSDNGTYAPPSATQGPHGIEGLLQGPGDGMSDHIPATIEGHTPARLANDEFVVPADVVSHLGNGSTSAGAKHLYGMLDRVRKARVGHTKQGKEIDPHEHLPA